MLRAVILCAIVVLVSAPGGAAPASEESMFQTVVTSQDVNTGKVSVSNGNEEELDQRYRGSYIDVEVLEKPHNLFIGRCTSDAEELHGQKIVVNNDGNSHVSAVIRFNVATDKEVEISCVNVYDEAPGIGAYPSYVGGGVGFNFVEIGVTTRYGKGFAFWVQIMGKKLKTSTNA